MLRTTPHSILRLFTRTLLPLLLLCAVLGTPVVAPAGEPAAKEAAAVPQGKPGVVQGLQSLVGRSEWHIQSRPEMQQSGRREIRSL